MANAKSLTGTKYKVIDCHCKRISIEMMDLDFLEKVCFVLDCEVLDLLKYQCPKIP